MKNTKNPHIGEAGIRESADFLLYDSLIIKIVASYIKSVTFIKYIRFKCPSKVNKIISVHLL